MSVQQAFSTEFSCGNGENPKALLLLQAYHALNFALNFLCRHPDDEHLPGVSNDTRSISPTVEDIPTVSSSSSSVIDDPPRSRSSSPMSTSDKDTARTTFRGRGRGRGRIRGRGIRGRGRGAIRGCVGTRGRGGRRSRGRVGTGSTLPSTKTLHDSDTASLNVSEFKASHEPGSYVASDGEERLTPLNFFKQFFTEDLAQMICENSNKYAEKHKDRSPFNYSRYPGMIPSLLYHLVGLFIYFGLEKLPSYTDYWTTSGDAFTLYGLSFAGRGMMEFLACL